MKLSYKQQILISIVLVLVGNTLNMLVHHWAFSSGAKIIAGLMWLIHPVMPGTATPTKRDLNIIRLGGVILIIWGLMSRLYLY